MLDFTVKMARWEWWGIFIRTSNALSSLASRTFGSFMTGRRQPLNWRQRSSVCSRGMQLRTFPFRSSAKLTTWKIRFWLLEGHTTANPLFTPFTSTTLFANHCKRRVTWEGMIENKSETYKCLRAENNLFRLFLMVTRGNLENSSTSSQSPKMSSDALSLNWKKFVGTMIGRRTICVPRTVLLYR